MEQVNFHFWFLFFYVAVWYLHLEDTFLDHFLQHKLVNQYVVLCVLYVILTFGSYIFGSFFATQIGQSICCFVRALRDAYNWGLHFRIIFCNTNWSITILFCACSVFGSFLLLMICWIICPCVLYFFY